MKEVLISIMPKWCMLIINGEKTIEVRKTFPHIKAPFKCYIYCTKNKGVNDLLEIHSNGKIHKANGKVIGEFVCDGITPARPAAMTFTSEFKKRSCLTVKELLDYAPKKPFPQDHVYGWHIKGFKLYDVPKELSDFTTVCKYRGKNDTRTNDKNEFRCVKTMTRAPQSWCYVEGA